MGWTHLKCERTTALCVKLNTCACRGIPHQANIWSKRSMYGKRKSGAFFAVRVGSKVSFLEISQRWPYVIQSQQSNVQVTIFVTCLNFAGTGSRILLIHWVWVVDRVIPSQKNCIEFQWGSKLQGTSSEALVLSPSCLTDSLFDPLWKSCIGLIQVWYVPYRHITHRSIVYNSSLRKIESSWMAWLCRSNCWMWFSPPA